MFEALPKVFCGPAFPARFSGKQYPTEMTTSTQTGLPDLDSPQAQPPAAACWSCGCAVNPAEHFCPRCGKVQPSGNIDHFSFFGLPRRLRIDLPGLQGEFYRLSRKLHPDMSARGKAVEQQWSLEKSSQLNDAYRILRDPIARTEYLLELEGVKLEEQSQAATQLARQTGNEKKQVVPPDLLEEAFELNMQLEELRAARKMGEADAELEGQLQSARAQFEAKLEALRDELEGLWKQWDAALAEEPASPERLRVRDRLVDLLNRRSYIRNLVRDVQQVLAA